jgi:hypothetical protein
MVQSIQAQLDGFNPATAGTYDPGQVVIFFDHRSFISEKDSMSRYQSYWLQTKSRLGWPSFWYTSDLEPGKLRLVWYTVSLKTSNHSGDLNRILTSHSTPAPKADANTPCTWPTQ